MKLQDMKETVSKYAETISQILEVSVVVVDTKLERVGNTYQYPHKPTPIRRNSIIGQVITKGEPMAVDSIESCSICRDCPNFHECDIKGVIAVPILLGEEIIGAFCLIVPQSRNILFRNLKSSIAFLENMAELLSEKISSAKRYEDLSAIRRDRELIMDVIEDAIVSTDRRGAIDYLNDKFESCFGLNQELIGTNIQSVVDQPVIKEMLHAPNHASGRLICHKNTLRGRTFYGFVRCYPKTFGGEEHGILFVFRSLSNVNTELNEISGHRTSVLFNHFWGQGREMQALLEQAKLLATTDESILIEGEDGTGKESMAKAIHNFSNRADEYFVSVDCSSTALVELDRELFGYDAELGQVVGIGKVRLAHKGTLLFVNINQMPLYFQEQVARFIKTRHIEVGNFDGPLVDTRLLFTSSEDLYTLMKRGHFCEELYFRIIKNRIRIPSVRERTHTDNVTALESAIKYFKKMNHKPRLTFEREALKALCDYSWPGNIQQIETAINRLVYICNTTVTAEDVYRVGITDSRKLVCSIEELEREQITKLVREGHSKDEIARVLGMGRATLYRKIKKYNIVH